MARRRAFFTIVKKPVLWVQARIYVERVIAKLIKKIKHRIYMQGIVP